MRRVGGAGVHASREGGRYYRKSADASEGEFDGEIDDAARDDVAADRAAGADDYDEDELAEEYEEIEGDPVDDEVTYIGDGYIDADDADNADDADDAAAEEAEAKRNRKRRSHRRWFRR